MRLHIDVLGWLYLVWGGFGLLTGTSLVILAVGAREAMVGDAFGLGERAALGLLLTVAGVLLAVGAASALTGWFLRQTRQRARHSALLLAVPTLVVVPFGTALGMYTFWVLLNNDARRVFGRALRSS